MKIDSRKTLTLNVFAFLAYFLAGALFYLFSGPPNHIVNIWPAYGLGLGLVLAWGRGVLPGLFLGSFATSTFIAMHHPGPYLSVLKFFPCTMVALGLVLQTLIARQLIKKFVGLNNKLISAKSIVLFIFLAGPVASLFNSTWSNTLFVLLGHITTFHDFCVHWLAWWQSDSIGAVIFTPLCLIVFAKPRYLWRRRIPIILVPVLVTFILLTITISLVNRAELKRIKFEFNRELDDRIALFSSWINAAKGTSNALAAFISSSHDFDQQQFNNFGKHLLKTYPFIQAVEWVPQVKDKARFNKTHHLHFWRYSNSTENKGKKPFYPVLYTYPADDNKQFIGYDVSSDPRIAKAIFNNPHQHEITLSTPVQLMQYKHKQIGVLVFAPVYKKNKFTGLALVVIRLTNALATIFNNQGNYSKLSIAAVNNNKEKTPIFNFIDKQNLPSGNLNQLNYQRSLVVDKNNQQFVFSGISAKHFIRSEFSWHIYFMNLLTLFICVLMEVILLVIYGQKYVVEEKVDAQTAKLKTAKTHLERIAHFDILTGLPNRFSFQTHMEQALQRARQHHRCIAICFLDLDNFKMVNDSLGHSVGDQLLKTITQTLQSHLRPGHYIARLSGDEFGLILENVQLDINLASLINHYLALFNKAFLIEDKKIEASVSIGIALYPFAGKDVATLIKNADIAMYYSKNSGKNTYTVFNKEIEAKVTRKHFIKSLLENAVAENRLFLVYQPQVCAASSRLYGVEVLLRLFDHDNNIIEPNEFIPIAEESGLIIDIGKWVLQQTVKEYKKLCSIDEALRVSINISVRQFEDPLFKQDCDEILNQQQIKRSNITFELTETAMIKQAQNIRRVLQELGQSGIRFALDDFGVGHSSLFYLKFFPIDYIKIDQSFVSNLQQNSQNANIVRAIINLAKTLNIEVFAEGVTNDSARQLLIDFGCEYLQGYYFAPPMRIDKLVSQYKLTINHPVF